MLNWAKLSMPWGWLPASLKAQMFFIMKNINCIWIIKISDSVLYTEVDCIKVEKHKTCSMQELPYWETET